MEVLGPILAILLGALALTAILCAPVRWPGGVLGTLSGGVLWVPVAALNHLRPVADPIFGGEDVIWMLLPFMMGGGLLGWAAEAIYLRLRRVPKEQRPTRWYWKDQAVGLLGLVPGFALAWALELVGPHAHGPGAGIAKVMAGLWCAVTVAVGAAAVSAALRGFFEKGREPESKLRTASVVARWMLYGGLAVGCVFVIALFVRWLTL